MTQAYERFGFGRIQRWLFVLCLALCSLFICWLPVAAVDEDAFPRLQGDIYAQDFTGTLTPDVRRQINMLGRALENKTGAQVAVAIMPTVPNGDIDTYATDLFRYWGVGSEEDDNGILLLVAPSENRVRIEVGYGLEGAVNDAKAGGILDNYFLPPIREGDMESAVIYTYAALVSEVMHEYGITAEDLNKPGRVAKVAPPASGWDSLPWWVKGAIIFVIAGLIFLDIRYNEGLVTYTLLFLFVQLLSLVLRGGGGGGSRGGGGGRSGGGGAGRSW